MEKSKVLIIGGTGYFGKFIVQASANSGHPTFALVRPATAEDPSKADLLNSFTSSGVTLMHRDLFDRKSLVKATKKVDAVISTVSLMQLADQIKIIDAINEAGNIKKFLPSDFGLDVDRAHSIEPAKSVFVMKSEIRRAVEASSIPYTFVSCNNLAGYSLPTLAQAEGTGPPADKIIILGDGNPKAIFVAEEDVGTYIIKAVDDSRTLNKILYIRPPSNIYSRNELVSLWEKKTGKNLEKIYVPEDELLEKIQEAPMPLNIMLAINYSVFVKGDNTNFEIEPSFGVEACKLYPDVNTPLLMNISISLFEHIP